jgi:hypothetical protein
LRPIAWKSAGAPCQPSRQLAAQHRRSTRAAAAPRACVADRWGPLVIFYLAPVPAPDSSAAAPSPSRARLGRVARMPTCSTGLFKAAAAPWTLPSKQNAPPSCLAASPQTLAQARRRRRRIPPPSSFRRQGIAPEPRKEVSIAPTLHVVVPVHPAALGTSPEFAPRAAASTARAAAPPPKPPP